MSAGDIFTTEADKKINKLEGQLLAMHVTLNDQETEVERLETMVRWARADSEALNIENAKLKSALLEAMEGNWLASDAPPRFEVDNLPEADGDTNGI